MPWVSIDATISNSTRAGWLAMLVCGDVDTGLKEMALWLRLWMIWL